MGPETPSLRGHTYGQDWEGLGLVILEIISDNMKVS